LPLSEAAAAGTAPVPDAAVSEVCSISVPPFKADEEVSVHLL
jgi:hypothetical protein